MIIARGQDQKVGLVPVEPYDPLLESPQLEQFDGLGMPGIDLQGQLELLHAPAQQLFHRRQPAVVKSPEGRLAQQVAVAVMPVRVFG